MAIWGVCGSSGSHRRKLNTITLWLFRYNRLGRFGSFGGLYRYDGRQACFRIQDDLGDRSGIASADESRVVF